MLVLSPKPLKRLTGTDGLAGRRTGGQDHILSQADALTKNYASKGTASPVMISPRLL